jgi:hypothetical protein
MDEAALAELLATLGPDGLQQMIDAGLFSDQMGLEGQQAGLAADLWKTPGAQGQAVGGTYVAANPLEHLATAMGRGLGAMKMQESQGRQADLIAGKGLGMDAFIKALAQRQQTAPAWPGIPYPMP